MLRINYDPIKGQAISDGAMGDFLDILLARHRTGVDVEISVSSFMFIDMVRLRILQGAIAHDAVALTCAGHDGQLSFDEYAKLSYWPPALQQLTMILRDMGRLVQEKTKAKKQNGGS